MLVSREINARWICCPFCDKKKCEREADDCDVKIFLKDSVWSEVRNDNEIESEG